jgi:hypothetical protein
MEGYNVASELGEFTAGSVDVRPGRWIGMRDGLLARTKGG